MGSELERPDAKTIIEVGVAAAVAKAGTMPRRLRNETYTLEMVLVLTDAISTLSEKLDEYIARENP